MSRASFSVSLQSSAGVAGRPRRHSMAQRGCRIGSVAVLLLFFAAFPVRAAPQDAPVPARPAADSSTRKERDDFVNGVEKELAAARERLDSMKRDIRHASGKARTDMQSALHSLERQHRAVRGKLSRLKATAGDKWMSLKEGVQTELERLKQSLRKRDSTPS